MHRNNKKKLSRTISNNSSARRIILGVRVNLVVDLWNVAETVVVFSCRFFQIFYFDFTAQPFYFDYYYYQKKKQKKWKEKKNVNTSTTILQRFQRFPISLNDRWHGMTSATHTSNSRQNWYTIQNDSGLFLVRRLAAGHEALRLIAWITIISHGPMWRPHAGGLLFVAARWRFSRLLNNLARMRIQWCGSVVCGTSVMLFFKCSMVL